MKLVEEEGKKIGVEIILEDIMVDEKCKWLIQSLWTPSIIFFLNPHAVHYSKANENQRQWDNLMMNFWDKTKRKKGKDCLQNSRTIAGISTETTKATRQHNNIFKFY